MEAAVVQAPAQPTARERILSCAYDLFSRRGIRDVGTDEIIAVAGVAKATLYRHFRSKDDLVVAFLERREQLWTYGLINARSQELADEPEAQLLAIFDVFDEWFRYSDNFEGCSFINVLLEMGADHPAGRASIAHLENIRNMVRELAVQAGLRHTEEFAQSWHILMKGSIISATAGDLDAAKRAQAMGRTLIEQHR
ncbi:TetR/AcrR family transcriptional regulator [Antrihabitans stalactiti]|uniref:TetR/AcrR family transcriptional regulator n=1 Tax=Antrihabitans stalactiti TaxID=2584121 RepID=A0A848KCG1_9NOCA|nr:TetR/AcrR family transcriptional regulator [Antrihabitans stalactiti]NMN93747.1 TetR/AcrR family transcriptional regulator [Antrihabitans stalactiti]